MKTESKGYSLIELMISRRVCKAKRAHQVYNLKCKMKTESKGYSLIELMISRRVCKAKRAHQVYNLKCKMKTESKGYSLIELMISMSISVIILSATLQLFLTIKQIFSHQQALARIQENGRAVNVLLGEAVKTNGNCGCNHFTGNMSLFFHEGINPRHYGFFPNIFGITLSEFRNHPLIPISVKQRIKLESDILWLQSVDMKKGEVLVLSDCTQADFFTPSHQKNPSFKLSKQYPPNAVLGELCSRLFYVGDTYRKNANNQPIYALYSTTLKGRTLELVEGVEYLKVLYKVGHSDTNLWLSLNQIKNWHEVIGIKVSLLLNSVEEGLNYPQDYEINNIRYHPTDKMIRRWWTYQWQFHGVGQN